MADDIADNPALAADDKVRRLDVMEAVLKDPARRDVPVAADMRESLKATACARGRLHRSVDRVPRGRDQAAL